MGKHVAAQTTDHEAEMDAIAREDREFKWQEDATADIEAGMPWGWR